MMFSSVYSAIPGRLLLKFTTSCQAKSGAINAAMAGFWHDAGSSIALPTKLPTERSLDTGKNIIHPHFYQLSALRRDLCWCTLCLLLACNASSNLPSRCVRRGFGLLCLLLALRCSLPLLAFVNGSLASCTSSFRSLGPPLLDYV